MRLAVIVLISALGLVLAGCSASISTGGNTVKQSDEVTVVQKSIALAHNPPAKSISCPDNVTPKNGATFECTVVVAPGSKAGGQPVPAGSTAIFKIRMSNVTDKGVHLAVVSSKLSH
jgi:hypothetical protein